MRRGRQGGYEGCAYVGVRWSDEDDAGLVIPGLPRTREGGIKNEEDDGVRLKLSVERKREIGENIRACVSGGREYGGAD